MKTYSNNTPEIQTIRLSLPRNLILKAKHYAAIHNKSLIQLMREALVALLEKKDTYEDAMKRQLNRMKQHDLGVGGKILWNKDDLYK